MKKRKVKNTRAKGNSLEYETQRFMKDRLVNFTRVGMSGQLKGLKGDFEWTENGKIYRGEAKSGSQVPAWLYKTLLKDDCDFLVVKRDRQKILFVITEKLLEELL